MANIATLTVNLVAETAKFTVGLKKSRREANQFAGQVKRTLGKLAAIGGTTFAIRGIVDAAIQMQQFERALKVATGSADGARREMAFVTKTANDLGLSLETTAGSFSKLAAAAKGTALQGQASRDIFVGISQASRVLGLSAEQTGGALTAIEQIISKGKVSAEELRGQLGERLPGAFQIAARSIGVTTSRLDEMLKRGELLAEDLLPSLAKELSDTFGPEVEAAANDAQAAINRFSTSIFQLKVAIAESGVLDALTRLANLASATATGIGAGFFNADPNPFGKEIRDAEGQLENLRLKLKLLGKEGTRDLSEVFGGDSREQIREQIAETERLIETLIGKQKQAFGLRPTRRDPSQIFGSFDKTNAELDEFVAKLDEDTKKAFDRFVANFETAEQEIARKLKDLDLFREFLPPAEFRRIRDEINSIATEGIEEIDLNRIRALRRTAKKVTVELSEFAKQAARNMQDAFADFFFDPFESGLKGMLQSFTDVIRRMVANLLASDLLRFLGSLGGPFGDFFSLAGGKGPGAALGGFRRNQPFIAGERGPELVSPGVGSTVTPFGATFMFETNINGGSNLNAAELIPILEQNNRQLKGEFLDELRRGKFS